MAAVPARGRASRVEGVAPAEAELTRALYERYANQIFRYCLHQLGSREEAEDAVQSTFLNAFRGIKRGVVPELESAWLFKIAHNVCLSRRRSSWRRGRVESPADFDVVEGMAPAPSHRGDELIGLQDVLEEMPESQRRAILLREWQGLSYREIAEELEVSQAAVETLIFRARRTLASGLERPPERRRVARAADWGNALTALKSLVVGGSAAAKVAATVAVVSATTVVAAEPIQHARRHSPAPAAAAAHAAPSVSAAKPAVHPVISVPAPSAAPHARPRHPVVTHPVPTKRHAARSLQPVHAPTTPAPVEAPTVQRVDQARPPAASAPARGSDQQAAKAVKHAAKAQGHEPPAQKPAAQEPAAAGTNPAGNAKEHGRWAAPSTPVADPIIPGPAPADQTQPSPAHGGGKAK